MTICHRIVSFALLAAAGSAVLPATAQACWDGTYAESDRVALAIADGATWSPENVRRYAKWIGRLDALVPEGKTVIVEHGYVTMCDELTDDCIDVEQTWDDDRLFSLFELTADITGATGKTVAAARRANVEPLTVQVAATYDIDAAYALADRINAEDLELQGFLDVGGFPSTNDSAHVVEGWNGEGTTYHVVVGAFLDRANADIARQIIVDDLGLSGYVRRLDLSSVSELGC